jgi:hypothetical protein
MTDVGRTVQYHLLRSRGTATIAAAIVLRVWPGARVDLWVIPASKDTPPFRAEKRERDPGVGKPGTWRPLPPEPIDPGRLRDALRAAARIAQMEDVQGPGDP